jgi:hypothetical protein
MTDKDYIAENITFGRNVMGWWEATFVCADGYQYHTCDKGNSRSIKDVLKSRLIETVMKQNKHPIR